MHILLIGTGNHIDYIQNYFDTSTVTRTPSVGNGIKSLHNDFYDIALFDLVDAEKKLDTLKTIARQQKKTPITVINRIDQSHKVRVLESGILDVFGPGDDARYIAVRMRAIASRSDSAAAKIEAANITAHDITINRLNMSCLVSGKPVRLSTAEFIAASALVEGFDETVLFEQLCSRYDPQSRSLDMIISNLRKKFASSSMEINSVPNLGYKLQNRNQRVLGGPTHPILL